MVFRVLLWIPLFAERDIVLRPPGGLEEGCD